MSVYLSCDGPQCDHTIAEEFAREFPTWLVLEWVGANEPARHFCSEDETMAYLRRQYGPAVTVVVDPTAVDA